MALKVALSSCLVFLLSLTSFASMATSEQCIYIVRVQTGNIADAGTDSVISLKLSSSTNSFTIANLEKWGIMGTGHDYFERGNLDIFQFTSACIDVCAMNVTSDDSGDKPGWYLDYVEVTVSGTITKQVAFPVDQWLALDEFPYHLYATVNLCIGSVILKPTLSSM